jgi:hypothetical protein
MPEPVARNLATIESLKANLSVIERSWNRLPPITSYRHGRIAQLELWLKRFFRKVTYWFTWEQVNFNSATANSLKEVQSLLSAHEQVLKEVRDQLEEIASEVARIQIDSQITQRKPNQDIPADDADD